MRITEKDLENLVDRLNEIKGFSNPKWGTVGSYILDNAYGGWEVNQIVNERGGVRNFSAGGHIPKRELHNQLRAILNAIR